MRLNPSTNHNEVSISLPFWVYRDMVRVLTAVAELPERWLEPCAFAITGACVDHESPSCPQQQAMALIDELARLGLLEDEELVDGRAEIAGDVRETATALHS